MNPPSEVPSTFTEELHYRVTSSTWQLYFKVVFSSSLDSRDQLLCPISLPEDHYLQERIRYLVAIVQITRKKELGKVLVATLTPQALNFYT